MKNGFIYILLIALIYFIPSSIQAQDPSLPDIDPFSSPNVIYTKYTSHGGGNVNQDEEDVIPKFRP